MKDTVMLKVKKDRLKIYLDPAEDKKMLKKSLLKKITEVKEFMGQVKTAIEFTGREISETEENEYLDIIMKNSEIEVTYVFSNGENSPKSKAIFDALKGEGKVKFFKGIIRSGTLLEYDGTIIILGDVNPGGIVKAAESVIVLGHLNGTVYAGSERGKDAFVGALYMNPIQIRIGSYIARSPEPQLENNKKIKKNTEFEIAYVNEDKIFIENYNKNILAAILLDNN